MKKLLFCMMCLFSLFAITGVCYAGDIPETLLNDNSAQVYFGEVKSVDEESITVIQRDNIKGTFSKDSEHTYGQFVFTEAPKKGTTYLCGYIDENNPLYIWEISGTDTKTLEISSTDDMSKRMQDYLNDGKFEKMEAQRLSEESSQNTSGTPSEGSSPDVSTGSAVQKNNNYIFALIICAIIVVRILFLVLAKRKK